MQDLTPVGLSKDGTRLVLLSASGEEYAVRVDTRLRAALRGEDARLGQLEMKMDSALRPRDIQARIRSGETPEQVAAAAQTTVDGIMAFASPVLAERAHVARTAQRASVRRRPDSAAGGGRTLGDAAELYFAEHHLHDEDVEWDAWRRPDGRWALTAQYAVEGRARTAEFSHDLPGRYVVAENDEARVLIGEMAAPTARTATGRTAPARRLASVREEDQLPLGDDAIELVRDPEPQADTGGERQPSASSADEDTTAVPLLGHGAETTTGTTPGTTGTTGADDSVGSDGGAEIRADMGTEIGADTADADWMTVDGAAPVDEPTTPDTATTQAEPDRPQSEPHSPPQSQAGESHVEDPAAGEADAEQASEKETRTNRRKGRSSVPTWDEIMFGGGKSE